MAELLGLHKSRLNTPCLVIDKKSFLHNLHYMQELAKSKNVLVRPHAKTHKCSTIAKLQLAAGSHGVCVAKVSEGLVLAKNGVTGILITSPVVAANKIKMLLDVVHIAKDTMVVIDNLENAWHIDKVFGENNIKMNVLLDIDGGIGRTGVKLEDAIQIIQQLQNFKNLVFKGIQCYAGHLQHITSLTERRYKSHDLLSKVAKIKNDLIVQGISCDIVTGSGTGTFSIDAEINAITEIQPGSYAVMDQEYSNIDYKEKRFLPAMTLLTTVISVNQSTHVTVDAGTKSLYRVATLPTVVSHPGLIYDWDKFGDEHGMVTVSSDEYSLPKLGEVLELVVGHCDPTINLFEQFIVTENDIVIDVWKIDARGCCF